ncbi:MAG TPA: hypothetical protein VEU51_14030 [Candidatus Acidoferrales bacterium]|nr:hypothetical protein [Candidatus Acidoferrales bacterium]
MTLALSSHHRARIVDAGALILILSLIATLAAPGRCAARDAAAPVTPHFEQTLLPYVVRVYFDKSGDGSDAYYEILRDDKPVYKQRARGKGEKFFIGTMYADDPDAPLVKIGADITGEGKPNLVVSEWTGGANCCLKFHIFEIGPTFRKICVIDAEFGDQPPHFGHQDKSAKSPGLQVLISDWTFVNWHSDFADSPAPKVILRYSDGTYRVSPDLMRTPAPPAAKDLEAKAADVRSYPASAKGGAWPQAGVAPLLWATMLDLIYSGHDAQAWKFLDSAWPPKVSGKDAFVRDFRAQLAKSPYWSAVMAMNAAKNPGNLTAKTPSPAPAATPAAANPPS